MKKRMKYPKCDYCKGCHDPSLICPEYKKVIESTGKDACVFCKEHHDTRVHCIAEMKSRSMNSEFKTVYPSCDKVHEPEQVKCEDIQDNVKTILKHSSEYYVEVADGKYAVYQEKKGSLKALRYGEPWQDLCGNNLVFFLIDFVISMGFTWPPAVVGILVTSRS